MNVASQYQNTDREDDAANKPMESEKEQEKEKSAVELRYNNMFGQRLRYCYSESYCYSGSHLLVNIAFGRP